MAVKAIGAATHKTVIKYIVIGDDMWKLDEALDSINEILKTNKYKEIVSVKGGFLVVFEVLIK